MKLKQFFQFCLWLTWTKAKKADSAVSHSLNPEDFLECIDEVRQAVKHEQDMFHLAMPSRKDTQDKDNGKKADESMLNEVETFEKALNSFATYAPASATDDEAAEK